MLIFIKSFTIILLFFQIILSETDILSVIIITIELIALISASSLGIQQLLKKNIIILGFSMFFGLFAFISGTLAQNLNSKEIIKIIIKIIFSFNCIYYGLRWIGKNGLIRIINAVPTERLNLFIIFFIKTLEYLIRTHNGILNQLRVRINLNYSGRLLIARYYVRNMIFKELYAYNHHQAAFYTRITEIPRIYVSKDNAGIYDIIALSALFAGTLTIIII
ncbi:MAG: hypothetical protein V1874_16610 [Spirochaetota bacterium]